MRAYGVPKPNNMNHNNTHNSTAITATTNSNSNSNSSNTSTIADDNNNNNSISSGSSNVLSSILPTQHNTFLGALSNLASITSNKLTGGANGSIVVDTGDSLVLNTGMYANSVSYNNSIAHT